MTEHDRFKRYIMKHSDRIFGESIRWRNVTVPIVKKYQPLDLAGTDSDGRTVIVELKTEFGKRNENDGVFKGIGQIVYYANAYVRMYVFRDSSKVSDEDLINEIRKLRLFIIGTTYSQLLENTCQHLRTYGFNIRQLTVEIDE